MSTAASSTRRGVHELTPDLLRRFISTERARRVPRYRASVEYNNAQTPFPSDSSPGMVAQVTGGNPRSTGYYYDDTWNHDVFPAGTTNCTGPVPGGEAAYEE